MLCGEVNGKEIQNSSGGGSGGKCISVADSLCCTVETNTTG